MYLVDSIEFDGLEIFWSYENGNMYVLKADITVGFRLSYRRDRIWTEKLICIRQKFQIFIDILFNG